MGQAVGWLSTLIYMLMQTPSSSVGTPAPVSPTQKCLMDRQKTWHRHLGGQAVFNEYMEFYMSFFNAIAAFKGAFLGALLGNHFPRDDVGTTRPYRPDEGASGHHRPHFSHTRPVTTYQHQQPVSGYHSPHRPLYPLFR
ncbi:hypothetical protein [Pseudomonas synxantha]|uniref:hypothetical protein n=1 Tax=Pseudomonas synxantha TaxID=47883 RepID=UPI00345D57B6